MSTLNKVMLIGRIGQDPEVRYSNSGMAIANASLATSNRKKSGEEETEWHRLVFFGKTAEIVEQYVRKGTQLYVEGQIKTESWEDKEGNRRQITKIMVGMMNMLSSKAGSEGNSSGQNHGNRGRKPKAASANEGQPNLPGANFDDMEDDIPF